MSFITFYDTASVFMTSIVFKRTVQVEMLEVKKPKRAGAFQGHYWLETEAPFSAILYWKRLGLDVV